MSLDSPYNQSASNGLMSNVFRLGGIRCQNTVSPENVAIKFQSISMELDHTGPEMITATGVAVGKSANQLLIMLNKLALRSTTRKPNMLFSILDVSRSKVIVDPLSTIQPSYLVQSGLPHQLRTDSTFKFLFYLRNCLWHLESYERRALSELMQLHATTTADETAAMLESCLISLSSDADTSIVADITILDRLFPNLRPPDAQRQPVNLCNAFHSASMQVTKISAVIKDPMSASFSQFVLTDLDIAMHLGTPKHGDFPHHTPTTQSRTSLREESIKRLVALISAGDITLTISPHLMRFAQQLLRVRRHHDPITDLKAATPITTRENALNSMDYPISLDLSSSFRRLRIQAAAENLIFEFGIENMQTTSTFNWESNTAIAQAPPANFSALFNEAYLRALSPRDASTRSDESILAFLAFTGVRLSGVSHQDLLSSISLQIILSIDSLRFSVPRSALRLYRFIEEWRADFFPGIEAALQELLVEIQKVPSRTIATIAPPSTPKPPNIQIHVSIASFGVSLQIMHGTWFSWDVYQIIAFFQPSFTPPHNVIREFGLQLASQSFSISSKVIPSIDAAPSTQLKLDLPTLSLTGRWDGLRIRTIGIVEFFHFKVKPSHWDTLLVVQQKFGQDFHDLMTLVAETRRSQRAALSVKRPSPPSSRPMLKFSGSLKMRGFRIGLEGHSSTIYLECRDIRGGIDPDTDRVWHARFSDLGLSLAPYVASRSRGTTPNRNQRSAFVVIDFQTSGAIRNSHSQVLQIAVTKFHAIMQPSSIGEIGDFVDHMQVCPLSSCCTVVILNVDSGGDSRKKRTKSHRISRFSRKNQECDEDFRDQH
jgi:hypothetical protein